MSNNVDYNREWRKRNSIRYHWQRLRWRSKQRKPFPIPCTISYEDFEEWCLETGYHLFTNIYGMSNTIDRIRERNDDGSIRGYEKGNLQMLTRVNNTIKENDRRKQCALVEVWKPVYTENPF